MADVIFISRTCRVTRAGPELAEPIYELIAECGRELEASGFRNLTPPPAPLEMLRQSAERDVVLIASSAPMGSTRDELIGTITLAGTPAHPYETTCHEGCGRWSAEPDALAWYISRLAVRPGWRRRGIGLELLTVAERVARERGVDALRLDPLLRTSDSPPGIGASGFRHGRYFSFRIRATAFWLSCWSAPARPAPLKEV